MLRHQLTTSERSLLQDHLVETLHFLKTTEFERHLPARSLAVEAILRAVGRKAGYKEALYLLQRPSSAKPSKPSKHMS